MGLSLGTIILPTSPSFFRKQQRILFEGGNSQSLPKLDPSAPRQNAKTTIELFSYAVVWWTLLAIVRRGLQVSRRMVCLPASRSIVQNYSPYKLDFLDTGKLTIYTLDRCLQHFVHSRILSPRYDLLPHSYLETERPFGSLG
jgi:hypothetical protein